MTGISHWCFKSVVDSRLDLLRIEKSNSKISEMREGASSEDCLVSLLIQFTEQSNRNTLLSPG